MDPLSEVLSLLPIRHSVVAGLKAGGSWAIDFPAPDGIKFNAIVHGGCWLRVDGVDLPIRLQDGDGFLLTCRRAFSLCSDPRLPTIPADTVYRHAVNGIASCGNADAFFLIGGRFAFGKEAALLLESLPPVAVVRSGSDQAATLNWALHCLARELATPSPGHAMLIQHLGQIMLVQVLRVFLAQAGPHDGWLSAIADPRLGAAIQAIHADPARRWTVQGLADIAALSRSAFAAHFSKRVGMPPLEYVLRWRMQLAAKALRGRRASISSVAQQLGYDSDSAFSHAFKRIMACSPRAYRQRSRWQADVDPMAAT